MNKFMSFESAGLFESFHLLHGGTFAQYIHVFRALRPLRGHSEHLAPVITRSSLLFIGVASLMAKQNWVKENYAMNVREGWMNITSVRNVTSEDGKCKLIGVIFMTSVSQQNYEVTCNHLVDTELERPISKM